MSLIPTVHTLRLTIADLPGEAEGVPDFLRRLETFLNNEHVTACGGFKVNVDLETGRAEGGFMILNNWADLEHITGRLPEGDNHDYNDSRLPS